VGAISKDEFGIEHIDESKCIYCGKCLNSCPFGAIFEISQVFDILQSIRRGEQVIALVAPAILSQYKSSVEFIYNSIKEIGFAEIMEVAQGAVITTEKESAELKEKLEEGQPFMTTSCCPSYVEMAEKHAPELKKYISSTRSPMHYTAQIAREKYPDAKLVFIGPCIAKRKEARKDEYVDYVMTFEELQSVFEGMDIQMTEEHVYKIPVKVGKAAYGFAQNGGVTTAVKEHVDGKLEFTNVQISNLNKMNVNLLRAYGKTGKAPAQFIEVMACEGGCISGPSLHTPYDAGRKIFDKELSQR
jgi:iron only hydrogenase large subunit-like protein